MTSEIYTQVENSWKLDNKNMDKLAKRGGDRLNIPIDQMKKYLNPNTADLEQF